MIDWLRALSPPLRYLMYVAGGLLVLFVAVGVGATTAVVVGWQFGQVASDPAKISTLEGSKSETTNSARALEDTAIESTSEAVSDIGSEAGSAVEVVGEVAGGAVEHVGDGVGEAAAEVAQSAGQATKQAGEATQEAGQTARRAAQGVGEAAGQAGDATEQATGGAQEDPDQSVEGTAAPSGAVLSETTDEAGSTVEQTSSESGEVSEKVVVGEASTTRAVSEQKGEVQLTRAAERRAKDQGVDLSQVEGTDSRGRIKEQRCDKQERKNKGSWATLGTPSRDDRRPPSPLDPGSERILVGEPSPFACLYNR
jgi:e3 binding domain